MRTMRLMQSYSVELHLHTCYSFLEGASLPGEMALQAAQLGYRALAITDHDGLHGAMAFAQACAAAGVQPITGVELTLAHGLLSPDSGTWASPVERSGTWASPVERSGTWASPVERSG